MRIFFAAAAATIYFFFKIFSHKVALTCTITSHGILRGTVVTHTLVSNHGALNSSLAYRDCMSFVHVTTISLNTLYVTIIQFMKINCQLRFAMDILITVQHKI